VVDRAQYALRGVRTHLSCRYGHRPAPTSSTPITVGRIRVVATPPTGVRSPCRSGRARSMRLLGERRGARGSPSRAPVIRASGAIPR